MVAAAAAPDVGGVHGDWFCWLYPAVWLVEMLVPPPLCSPCAP